MLDHIVNDGIVKTSVKKTYVIAPDEDRVLELTEEQAIIVRDFLNRELPPPKAETTFDSLVSFYGQSFYGQLKANEKLWKLPISSNNKKDEIPEGYVEIGRRSSEPRNGNDLTQTYIYFKDSSGNYAFKVQNNKEFSFARLGRISDPTSIISRCLRAMPLDQPVTRSVIARANILKNSGYLKAVFDILEIEEYLTKVPQFEDRRKYFGYYRTKKNKGLEVDHTRELDSLAEEVPMSSALQVAKPG